jgi:hypothetical protein
MVKLAAFAMVMLLSTAALAADRPSDPCGHSRLARMMAEPDPADARCNPMYKVGAAVAVDNVRWAQYNDDVCQWYWDYTMARSQQFSAYLNGYNIPGFGSGPPFTLENVETTVRFLVVGPPLYEKVAVLDQPTSLARNARGEWTRLGPDPNHHHAGLDRYVQAALWKVRPASLPRSMQEVYGRIVREPSETRAMLHGVFFAATFRTFSSATAPAVATYKVQVRCHQYVTDHWAKQLHRVGWNFTPFPRQARPDDVDYDLLPR